ncbi:hypothetical protein Xcel_3455 (plasmid) [Xylanimonas cellulosilytica DSM 15894]|uniref:Uncharacterized protein n=1 Tax=Xylanimonas cellulosilytica (strain DSM 15894 / JCM 12276 / CECT 5975 / KCTC 9989 / LMG 20990 / NBRC 107835 / XIL07) TaxID=446471 RepID=D1C0Y8_XYLCX|nr:hypothetical protein [Xylanimonas cellulosilytica]ACZ32454.1 hypothetical protein Xcel_3455 [Xylanimonas cellulosilytica DSM 15894]
MTVTTSRTSAPAVWPAPGLAWQLRIDARRATPNHAELLQHAADVLDAVGARVDDVEDLDALVLDVERPVDHVALIDRLGEVLVAHPDRTAEQVTVVRHPSLLEARTQPDDWRRPLAFPSSDVEPSRFPMIVISAPLAFASPEWNARRDQAAGGERG